MALSYLAIACLVGAALAGPFQRDVASRRCSVDCPTNVDPKFNYRPGNKYVYTYKGSNAIRAAGSMKQQMAELACIAEVTVLDRCEMSLQLRDVVISKDNVRDEEEYDLAHSLESTPLVFTWVDGRIEHICSSQEEPTASENIKKSILSLIINTMSDLHSSSRHDEIDTFGTCDTKYSIIRDRSNAITIKKEKSLMSCDNSLTGLTALISEQYSSPESDVKSLPIFTHDKRICEQEIRDRIIHRVVCKEQASVKPLSKYESIIELQAETHLTLKSVKESRSVPPHMFPMVKKSILFSYQQPDADSKEKEAQKILTELCSLSEGVLHPKVSKLYYDLIMVLKGLPTESIQKIYHSLTQKELCSSPKTLDIFLDALPMAGTEGSIKLMVHLLKEKKVSSLKAKLWPASFALIPSPNSEAVAAILPLISDDSASRSVMLGLSAMIHRVCSHRNCDELPAIQEAVRTLHERLGDRCSSDDNEKVLSVLKAFGNMGYLGESESTILACASSRDKHITVRLAAIDAFRRCKKELPLDLIQLFESENENFEVRILALSTMIRNADSRLKSSIEKVLQSSQDVQVVAYTKSLIKNWKKTSSPLKQDIKELLQEIDIGRDDVSYWENSKHLELSTFNVPMNLGASLESNIIHTPGSKIPRAFSSKVEVDLFGRNINLFEFGARAEGLEKSVKKLLGIDTSRSSTKKSWFALASRQESEDERPEASFYMRTMGTEFFDMSFSDVTSVGSMMQVADVFNKLAQGEKADFAHSFLFLNTKLIVQSVTGRSYTFGMTGSATAALTANGKFDVIRLLSSPSNCDIGGRIQPSVNVELATTIGIHSQKSRPDMKIVTSFHSGADVGGTLRVKDSYLAEARLDLPSEEMQLLKLSTELYEIDAENNEKRIIEDMETKVDGCLHWLEKPLGIQVCAQLETPKPLVSRKFPYAHGIGNVQLSIRKTDPSMTGYSLAAEIPKHRSNPMTYLLTFDTPGSSINRRFHGKLDLKTSDNGERQFSLDMHSPFKEFSSNGAVVFRRDLLQCSISAITDKTNRYSMKTVVDISTSGSKRTYRPTLQWKLPGKEAVSVSGSVVYDEDRKQHLMINLISSQTDSKPFVFRGNWMKEGRLSLSRNAQWKMSTDIVAKSPFITAKIHSTHNKRSGQANSINSEFAMEYGKPSSSKHSVKFSSEVQQNTDKTIVATQFECSQMPQYNWQMNLDMQGKLKDAMKNDILLKYGRQPEKKQIEISQTHHVGDRNSLTEGTLSVKAPHLNIDSDLKIAVDLHSKESSNWHFESDLRYKEDKHLKSLLQMKRLSRKPVKIALKAAFESPRHSFMYEDEITEIYQNIYQGQSKLQWKHNQKAHLTYTYKRLSDSSSLHHEIESSFEAPFLRSPLSHSSMVKLSKENFQIRSQLSQGRTEYSLGANFQNRGSSHIQMKLPLVEGMAEFRNEQNEKSASLDMHLLHRSQRHITANTVVSWKARKSLQAELAWDVDRNPSQKIAVSADVDISRKDSGISYNVESKLQCTDLFSMEFTSDGENSLRGPHKVAVIASGRKFQPIELTVEQELSSRNVRSLVTCKHGHQVKAIAELQGSIVREPSRSEIDASLSIKSPSNSFSSKKVTIRSSQTRSRSTLKHLSEASIELQEGKSHEAKIEYNSHVKQLKELQVSVKTPYVRFSEQDLSISHRVTSDGVIVDGLIGYSGKQISLTTAVKNNKNEASLVCSLKTPCSYARDVKFSAAYDKQKFNKKIESYLELNGERKYDIASTYKSRNNRREIISSFKTCITPDIAVNIKSEINLPSFDNELLVTKDSERILLCKLSHQCSGEEFKSQVEVKTSKTTILDVKAVREMKSSSIKKYTVKAKGLFTPFSVSVQTVKSEENSLSKTAQICRESPSRECYSVKAYYKKEAGSEKYNKYRKITFDVEKESKGSVQHLCNIHYLLSIQKHTVNSKLFIDSRERKVGYDFNLKMREQESEPCQLEVSFILPSRVMRARASALHSPKNALYDIEFTPDVAVASQKMSLQYKRDTTDNKVEGNFQVSHFALQKPLTVQYNLVKSSSKWPQSCKIEIDYSPDPRDKLTAEMSLSTERSRQKLQTLLTKVYSPGCNLDLSVKVTKQGGRKDAYVCEWSWQSINDVKSGELTVKVTETTPSGLPKTSEISYSSASSQLHLDVETEWDKTWPSSLRAKMASREKYLGEMSLRRSGKCIEYEIKDSEPIWKNQICYGQSEERQPKIFTFKAYHKVKCVDVSLHLEPRRARIANVGIQWNREELRNVAESFKRITPTLKSLPVQKICEELKYKARGVYGSLMDKLMKPLWMSLAEGGRNMYREACENLRELLDYLPEMPELRSIYKMKDDLVEKVVQCYGQWVKAILEYLEEDAPEWVKNIVQKVKELQKELLARYCSRGSLCYKVKTTYQRQGMTHVRRVLRSALNQKIHQMQQYSGDRFQQVSEWYNIFSEIISGWAEDVYALIRSKISYLKDNAIYRKFAEMYCSVKERIEKLTREYFDRFMEYLNHILDDAMQNQSVQLLSENIMEMKKQALESWQKIDVKKMWLPLKETLFKKYPRTWLQQRIAVQEFNPKEGRVSIQLQYPFTQSHFQLMKNAVVMMKNKLYSSK